MRKGWAYGQHLLSSLDLPMTMPPVHHSPHEELDPIASKKVSKGPAKQKCQGFARSGWLNGTQYNQLLIASCY